MFFYRFTSIFMNLDFNWFFRQKDQATKHLSSNFGFQFLLLFNWLPNGEEVIQFEYIYMYISNVCSSIFFEECADLDKFCCWKYLNFTVAPIKRFSQSMRGKFDPLSSILLGCNFRKNRTMARKFWYVFWTS